MSLYRSGQTITLTSGQKAVIWDAAPDPGTYWAHLVPSGEVVCLRVSHPATSATPIVTIKEEW